MSWEVMLLERLLIVNLILAQRSQGMCMVACGLLRRVQCRQLVEYSAAYKQYNCIYVHFQSLLGGRLVFFCRLRRCSCYLIGWTGR